jgi:hypothetical protein
LVAAIIGSIPLLALQEALFSGYIVFKSAHIIVHELSDFIGAQIGAPAKMAGAPG